MWWAESHLDAGHCRRDEGHWDRDQAADHPDEDCRDQAAGHPDEDRRDHRDRDAGHPDGDRRDHRGQGHAEVWGREAVWEEADGGADSCATAAGR